MLTASRLLAGAVGSAEASRCADRSARGPVARRGDDRDPSGGLGSSESSSWAGVRAAPRQVQQKISSSSQRPRWCRPRSRRFRLPVLPAGLWVSSDSSTRPRSSSTSSSRPPISAAPDGPSGPCGPRCPPARACRPARRPGLGEQRQAGADRGAEDADADQDEDEVLLGHRDHRDPHHVRRSQQ